MRSVQPVILLMLVCGSLNAAAERLFLQSGTEKNHLIELYTSEGCSSCPAADRWISELKHSDRLWHDLIPVAFHVDYWNQLGWTDDLAREAFSQRQRRYHKEGSISQVYTPGFVVDGQEWRGFFKRKKFQPPASVDVGEITVDIDLDSLSATFIPKIASIDHVLFHTAVLGFDIEKDILAGENAGKTLYHDFAVIAYDNQSVTLDNNKFSIEMQLPRAEKPVKRKAIVVWVSETGSQSPLQVTGSWL